MTIKYKLKKLPKKERVLFKTVPDNYGEGQVIGAGVEKITIDDSHLCINAPWRTGNVFLNKGEIEILFNKLIPYFEEVK